MATRAREGATAGAPRPGAQAASLATAALLALTVGAAEAAGRGAPAGVPISGLGLALLALWAAVVSIGERALGPLGFEEPLVAGAVAGLIVGRPADGMAAGITLQLIWPGLVPMGGSAQPAAGLAAVSTAAWLGFVPEGLTAWRMPFALGAGMAASAWAGRIEDLLRRRNARRLESLLRGPAESWRAAARRATAAGLVEAGLRGALAAVALVGLPGAVAIAAAQRSGSRGLPGPGGSPWGVGLLPWAFTPVLFLALGAHLRLAVQSWRAPAPGGAERGTPTPGTKAGRLDPGRMWDLLTLQGAFSARHLQRCGFLASVGPARGGSPAVAALRTALADGPPPNTHPVLAAALVGALERAEADAADAGPPRPLARLVEIGGPILAQWGDRAIWGGARRLWGAVAVLLALPFGLAAALAMAGVSLALHMLGRVLLRRWGWRVGWDLVRGGSGWLWRRGPRWAERAGLPVSAGVLAVAATLGWSAGPSAGAFGLRLVWFMLGVLLGGSAHRPTAWGWICWVAASVGAGLDVWSARTGW